MKQKFLQREATINIKIPIETDEYLRSFIFKNINMRRFIWNEFVEEANKFVGEYHMYDDFKPMKFLTEYKRAELETRRYDEYCVGLSEQVAKDMKKAIKSIRTSNRKVFKSLTSANLGTLKFHKRDNYYGSFKVHVKPTLNKDNLSSRIKILDKNNIKFRVRSNRYKRPKESINIYLKENLYDEYYEDTNEYVKFYKENNCKVHEYRFHDEDIKEISFIHELGKFYIILTIKGLYYIDNEEIKSRIYEKAGIDTGIHNPFMIYDGKSYFSLRMSDKISNKIHYLERRIKRLKSVMDKKYLINNERVHKGEMISPYSHNYEKIRKRYRKIWKKIINIRRAWSYKITKFIVTRYKTIVVDRFNQPETKNNKKYPNKIIRKFNYVSRFHCMYITNEILVHMANKYGCRYIEAPGNTTCTCSCCGHINPHLSLDVRMFRCEDCGFIIDRDENASKNCYDFS